MNEMTIPTSKPSNRGQKYPAEVLSPTEIESLVKACSGRAPTGIRNRALLILLWRSGLRISEALSLRPKDLDRDAGSLRVLRGKGKKARTVGLDAAAFTVLERWMDARSKLGINGAMPLFCTLRGRKLDTSYVRALLPRLARKAGIEKRVHAHGLRHAFTTELAMEGVPVPVIQLALGHASLATTSAYLKGLCPQDVVDAMRSRTWTP